MEKTLLTLAEFCEYTGLGKTKARELLKKPECKYSVRIGNRLYVNKKMFDEYLAHCAKYNISI